MKKSIFVLLIGIATMFVFHSCKKDKEENISLIGSWGPVGAEMNGQDIWDPELEDCKKDNLTIIKEGGIYTDEEGATKCDPNDPQIMKTGSWNWITEGKEFAFDGQPTTIEKLSASELVISFKIGKATYKTYFKRR